MAHHLAEINIARFIKLIDDPSNSDFLSNLDRVNAIADASRGFVWRLVGEGNNSLDVRPSDDPQLAVNISVWTDLDALVEFVHRTGHRDIMRRRREWFEPMRVYMALWWIPAGHMPSVQEGMQAIATLSSLGPTRAAFTFRNPFPRPGSEAIEPISDKCA